MSKAVARTKAKFGQCSKLTECVDEFHPIPPTQLAAAGDVDALKNSIEKFDLTLKERDSNGATLLHHATRGNQVSSMMLLIVRGVGINEADKDGNTPLHLAAELGHSEGIRVLLDSGANCFIHNNQNCLPLHLAAKDLSGNGLRALLPHYSDVFVRGPISRTLLHILAETNNLEGCQAFFDNKANVPGSLFFKCATEAVKLKDDNGYTAVHLAARSNSHKVLKFAMGTLKSQGHLMNDLLGLLNEENNTAMHMAVDSGSFEALCVLLEYGASPVVKEKDVSPPLHLACSLGRLDMVRAMVDHAGVDILACLDHHQRCALYYTAYAINGSAIISFAFDSCSDLNINRQDGEGRTLLHAAVMVGNLPCVTEVLSRGASPILKDSKGCNVLHLAFLYDRKPVILELLKSPMSWQMITDRNDDGYTPFHIALRLGLGDIMLEWVHSNSFSSPARGSSQSMLVRDSHGNSCVHHAAASGDWKVMEEILDTPNGRTFLNDLNQKGETPLHLAARKGRTSCVERLLSRGALVHKTYEGLTPLMTACGKGQVESARLLTSAYPFQLNWQDCQGNTAIHHAAKEGWCECIKLLLGLGSKVLLNDDGETFVDVVVEGGHEGCALAVVKHNRWQECLDKSGTKGTTPFVFLVERMPSVAKLVLDKCYDKDRDLYNFKYLLNLDESLTGSDEPMEVAAEQGVGTIKKIRGGHDIVNYRRSVVAVSKSNGMSRTMGAVLSMVAHKRRDLFSHPVVVQYLRLKWRFYGAFFFTLLSFVLLLNLIFLSSFILGGSRHPRYSNVSQSAENLELEPPLGFFEHELYIQVLRFGSILFTSILLAALVSVVLVWFSHFGKHWAIYLDLACAVVGFLVTFIFLLLPDPFHPEYIYFGIFAGFFAWFFPFIFLKYSGLFGTYVTMFFMILFRVFQVAAFFVFVLMAFAIPLYLLGFDLTAFSSIWYSLLSVFGFVIGDVDFSPYLEISGKRNATFVVLIVVVAAIILGVVVENILIGLAVGDIEEAKRNASYNRMSQEAAYFHGLDEALPRVFYRKVIKVLAYSRDSTLPKFVHHGYESWPYLLNQCKSCCSIKGNFSFSKENSLSNISGSAETDIQDLRVEMAEMNKKLQMLIDLRRSQANVSSDGSCSYVGQLNMKDM